MDVGDMFLNFPLHPEMRPYAGVDITYVKGIGKERKEWENDRTRKWERWTRNFMGLTDSPYRSLQLIMVGKQLAYGRPEDLQNPFQWDRVVLNLPGTETYDPR